MSRVRKRRTLRIFRYIEALDAFVLSKTYRIVAAKLGFTEWETYSWIGRYIIQDNDFGEHWFDHSELRAERANAAKAYGIEELDLLIIDPKFFQNEKDGPCHAPEERKRFWTDLVSSLELSVDLICDEARRQNGAEGIWGKYDYIPDLEDRIVEVKRWFRSV